MTPEVKFATFCISLVTLTIGGSLNAALPKDAQPQGIAALDPLVGDWEFRINEQDGFSARQECQWILNKRFLEINTRVLRPGHPPVQWRSLIAFDGGSDCYREWRFSDKGEVHTSRGDWSDGASLQFSGQMANGNNFRTSYKLIDKDTIAFSSIEDVANDKRAVIRLTLSRAATKAQPPVK